MNRNQLEFVSYCAKNLADGLENDTIVVYDLFKNSGVLYGYIVPLYGILLHTQGRDYIVEGLWSVLQKKGSALCSFNIVPGRLSSLVIGHFIDNYGLQE